MRRLLSAVISREQTIDIRMWRPFWDRLHAGELLCAEAAATLTSLSVRLPDPESASALVASLHERRPRTSIRFDNAVNVVGTGGGPRTFNISTAAALVAAAQEVPIVKTGSGAYTGRMGSYDLLRRLGVSLTTGYDETAQSLVRYGIAFAGPFVYPVELALLARAVAPLDFRVVGQIVNLLGPFLADVDTSAQLTGVTDATVLPVMEQLARAASPKRIWLSSNELGVDELISFVGNDVRQGGGTAPVRLEPGAIGLGTGALADLAPARELSLTVAHFLALLAGDAPPAAVQTVCLNAAALAILAGHAGTWRDAVSSSADVIAKGHAVKLVERLRAHSELAGHVLR
jgi:anthranilate phosphoribosyltransferase